MRIQQLQVGAHRSKTHFGAMDPAKKAIYDKTPEGFVKAAQDAVQDKIESNPYTWTAQQAVTVATKPITWVTDDVKRHFSIPTPLLNGPISTAKYLGDILLDEGESRLRVKKDDLKDIKGILGFLDEHYTPVPTGHTQDASGRPLIIREFPNGFYAQLTSHGRTLNVNQVNTTSRWVRKEKDGDKRLMMQVSSPTAPKLLQGLNVPSLLTLPDWAPSAMRWFAPLITTEEQARYMVSGEKVDDAKHALVNLLAPTLEKKYRLEDGLDPSRYIEKALDNKALKWTKDTLLLGKESPDVRVLRGSSEGKDYYIMEHTYTEKAKPEESAIKLKLGDSEGDLSFKVGDDAVVLKRKSTTGEDTQKKDYYFAWKDNALQPLLSLKLSDEVAARYQAPFDELLNSHHESGKVHHRPFMNRLMSPHHLPQHELGSTYFGFVIPGGVAGYNLGQHHLKGENGMPGIAGVKKAYGAMAGAVTTPIGATTGKALGAAMIEDETKTQDVHVMKNVGMLTGAVVGAAASVPVAQAMIAATPKMMVNYFKTVGKVIKGVFV
ncbi:MAG: hypothetical protein ACKO37_03965 [Vampirovibrionales bacterium]